MNSDKLNSLIKKKTNGNNEISLHLHKMFFFEHVLLRLEKSRYRENIILKGGVLLSSIIGNELRTTKDMDATIKSIPLTTDNINDIFNEILSIDVGDGVIFKIESIEDIRIEDEYGGYRINVYGEFDKIKTNFFIEITTGDVITPKEIKYKYNSIFENEIIKIMTYNIETIIAEKFESIISKNITTTRSKDFYDIYMLMNEKKSIINNDVLIKSIKSTFKRRGTSLDSIDDSYELISSSNILKNNFNRYKSKLPYVERIEYEDTLKSINEIVRIIKE